MKLIRLAFSVLAPALAACSSTRRAVTDSASGKNLDLSGYVMLGELETANNETLSPEGRMILGRVAYKSRKVGIPAEQKVPNTGSFRATKSTSLFGAEETIIEYDWTAGSESDARDAEQRLRALRTEAERTFGTPDRTSPQSERTTVDSSMNSN